MSLRKATGNMYKFVTGLWNPVKGRCPYQCTYCYVSRIFNRFRKPQREPYFDGREFEAKHGSGNTIFVCDSIDLFAPEIPYLWQRRIRQRIYYDNNTYILHTKNPGSAADLFSDPELTEREKQKYILCATIESDLYRPYISKAPDPVLRFGGLRRWKGRRMITVEPVMQFSTAFAEIITRCDPEQVNIGADTGHNNLSEPSAEELRKLIAELESAGIRVVKKANLRRLLDE